jgi:hypothetical protein
MIEKLLRAPDFDKILWPYFINNSACISKIFLFSHKEREKIQKKINKITEIVNITPEDVFQINGLNMLDNRAVFEIEGQLRWSWNYSVFFYTEDFDFIKRLCHLFPWPGKFIEDELPITKKRELPRLKQFLENNSQKGYLIYFFNEGYFIKIWGDEDSLMETTKIY